MKIGGFVKVILVVFIILSFIGCNNITSSNSNQIPEKFVDNMAQPPEVIINALTNRAKERCQKNNWECKEFKINSYEEIERDDADKANEVEKKGYASLSYINRSNSSEEWQNSLQTLEFKLKKNGDLQARYDLLIPLPKEKQK